MSSFCVSAEEMTDSLADRDQCLNLCLVGWKNQVVDSLLNIHHVSSPMKDSGICSGLLEKAKLTNVV